MQRWFGPVLVALVVALPAVPMSAQSNLVINSGFDDDLSGWGWDPQYAQAPGAEQWSPLDANGSPDSGSMLLRVTAAGRARQLLQCVNINPGQIYEIGTRYFFPSGQGIIGEALIAYVEYEAANCTGPFTGFGELAARKSDATGTWETMSARPPISTTARSFQAILGSALRDNGSFAAHFDDVVVRLIPPTIVLPRVPDTMVQIAGEGDVETSFTISNVGDLPALIHLERQGTFFSVHPETISIAPRGNANVVVTASSEASGMFVGTIQASGDDISQDLTIPIRLATIDNPTGGDASAGSQRIDVTAPAGSSLVESSLDIVNSGGEEVEIAFGATEPWIRIPEELIRVGAGETRRVPFEIDRTRRFDESDISGSVTGSLVMVQSRVAGAMVDASDGTGVGASLVTVKDSAGEVVEENEIPSLGNRVAIFIPGVGHVRGSVGTFVSDISLAASKLIGLSQDLDMYYTTIGAAPGVPSLRLSRRLRPDQFLSYADVVRSFFGREGESGTLQIRLADPSLITLSASVFNKSNPAGTYGTSIPVLRSDRSVRANQSCHLVGLLGSSEEAHTNMVLQETAGAAASVRIDFRRADGGIVSTKTVTLEPFRAIRLDNVVPTGAVAATLTNTGQSNGRFLAYATPVDKALESDGSRRGGDTWVVTDWSRIYGYAPAEAVIIPVTGISRGAGGAFFRSDVAIMNTTSSEARGDMTFRAPGHPTVTREIRLAAHESAIYANALTSLFDLEAAPVGYLTFTPKSGAFALTSRIFATVGTQRATFGTGVPSLSLRSGLRRGQRTRISGFDDSSVESIQAQHPGTFRTNLGLVEASGRSATVRVTLHNYLPGGATSLSTAVARREYQLEPNGFLFLQRVSDQILGARRAQISGDLHDLFLDIEVIKGDGTVIPFISSIDNGTADQVLQTPYGPMQ